MTSLPLAYLVNAAIITKDNKIIIVRRAPNKHFSGYREFPVNKIEEGETSQEHLKRDLKEEFGIDLKIGDFFKDNEPVCR